MRFLRMASFNSVFLGPVLCPEPIQMEVQEDRHVPHDGEDY